jgi:hypothetical protein
MDKEFDKTLNGKTGFKYVAIDPKRHVRLLRFSHDQTSLKVSYGLQVVPLTNLRLTHYKALSYTWGHAYGVDIREIQIDGQPFFIRRNLFDFLASAASRDEYGLFFIDAICINQLNHGERQYQVQEMARIYRNANEVIAWLGLPVTGQLDSVRALSQATGSSHKDCATWTTSQWTGFRYLSYHNFWSRIWIVQEVLLASSMVVWCGSFTFPLALFGSTTGTLPSPKMKFAANGRPSIAVSAASRLRTPAEIITTHKLRQVPRPLTDPMAQGTKIGTIEEMTMDLRKASKVIVTYQSQIPDLLYQLVRKFGKQECSDPRDRLYGLLGILNERSRARVEVNYERDASYAYYQALKIGLQELYGERSSVVVPDFRSYVEEGYLAYYCDVRDAFSMEDGESLSILRQVLGELKFQIPMQDAVFEVQSLWRDAKIDVYPVFKQLPMHAEQEDFEGEGILCRYHTGQRRVIDRL